MHLRKLLIAVVVVGALCALAWGARCINKRRISTGRGQPCAASNHKANAACVQRSPLSGMSGAKRAGDVAGITGHGKAE